METIGRWTRSLSSRQSSHDFDSANHARKPSKRADIGTSIPRWRPTDRQTTGRLGFASRSEHRPLSVQPAIAAEAVLELATTRLDIRSRFDRNLKIVGRNGNETRVVYWVHLEKRV